MLGQEKNLHAILEPGVKALGYELLGVRYFQSSRPAVLRLYIDHENGVGLEDCAAVSRQVSGTLDVEDTISENYHLEVSSPGTDRPLFTVEHFQRFSGRDVKVRMQLPIEGQRNFRGRLLGVSDSRITVLVDGVERQLPLEHIAVARVIADSAAESA